jgi:hypothetical protein
MIRWIICSMRLRFFILAGRDERASHRATCRWTSVGLTHCRAVQTGPGASAAEVDLDHADGSGLVTGGAAGSNLFRVCRVVVDLLAFEP